MLRLLARLCAGVAALLLALALLAIYAARTQPPVSEPLFAVCALPCLLGLTPGQTASAAAAAILEQAPLEMDVRVTQFGEGAGVQQTFEGMSGSRYFYGFVLNEPGGRVATINVQIEVPLALLLEALNTPNCAWINSSDVRQRPLALILLWQRPGGLVTAVVSHQRATLRWDLQAAVTALSVSSVQYDDCPAPGMRWRGFAPLWTYFASPQPIP